MPLAVRAYSVLREQIATGALASGQRLTERNLASQLGVSPTPVREALSRLEHEGLVKRTGPKTLIVSAHSAQALEELGEAEIALRATLVRFAATKVVPGDVNVLAGIVDDLEAEVGADPMIILAIAARFDEELLVLADSPIVAGLFRNAEVFTRTRRTQAIRVMQTSRRDVGARHLHAHRDLVTALASSDGRAAEEIVRVHLRSSLDLLLSDLESSS
jgi:DNA-binding GntR family transcriptional regulator